MLNWQQLILSGELMRERDRGREIVREREKENERERENDIYVGRE